MIGAIINIFFRILVAIFLFFWAFLTVTSEGNDSKFAQHIEKINGLAIIILCIYGTVHIFRYSPIELNHNDILTYAENESENKYDPLEWLWDKYETEFYDNDDMIEAYSEGVSAGIDYSIEYYEYQKDIKD